MTDLVQGPVMLSHPDTAAPAPGVVCADGPYAGREAVLATMHGKETVIAPALFARLGLRIRMAPGIDTDRLGTFTGEIPRAGTIRQAAIAKARLGMAATGLPIGIASEGSYGPHPYIPFVPGGVELMVLVDDDRGIVVAEYRVEDRPAFAHAFARAIDDLAGFPDRVGFPDHALVVRPAEPAAHSDTIFKGVCSMEHLARAIAQSAAQSRDGRALIQTDMRAHQNPTRLAAISRLASALAERVATRCPACASPGYGPIYAAPGLPCEACGTPSTMVLDHVSGCVACDHRERHPRPDGRTHADPGECPQCNP